VPLAGGARQEALPHARRCTGIRRAKEKPERAQARPVHWDAIAERRRIQALLGEARKLLEGIKWSTALDWYLVEIDVFQTCVGPAERNPPSISATDRVLARQIAFQDCKAGDNRLSSA
jgi:hypothetical protein